MAGAALRNIKQPESKWQTLLTMLRRVVGKRIEKSLLGGVITDAALLLEQADDSSALGRAHQLLEEPRQRRLDPKQALIHGELPPVIHLVRYGELEHF